MNVKPDMTLGLSKEEEFASRASDPLWYKDAVIYQLHVKSFFDSNNDGIGDFAGLIERLDYLAELSVSAVWLLPFYPSPRRDDGYDIADYRGVSPDYGTVEDVRRFIDAAHARGIRVVTELVLNHTSDQHPWFQRARRAPPGSAERNFYVWSDSDKTYAGTRIIFLDTEKSNWTWDEEANAYYWHRFYAHQPDLNFDNPAVLEEALAVMRFWLDMGVDGLRLDAVPYLIEREGTNNENLPETHALLKRIRAEVDAHYPGRMLLAEANQWPEDVQQYFGDGDECHMLFHFPLMPRMYMAIAQEDRFPITDIMRQTPEAPDDCQWATFLRNHDELTLEMVTDRERDYLWNTYAADRRARLNLGIRRRLAPLLERDRRRIELMNSLLLTIMGTPILYYGDEIGMGDNIHLGDRDGMRTPMQWTSDRNGGFSRADPAALVSPPIMDPLYGYQAVNVEAQWRDPHSLLNWLRRMLAVRGRWKVFGRGTVRFLRPQNRKVLSYLRERDSEVILCVANVSRTAQAVELDLTEFAGRTPVELSGEVPFPKIGQLTYLLTLPPYGFYWFSLSTEIAQPGWSTATSDNTAEYFTFVLRDGLGNVLAGPQRNVLERDVLPAYLMQRRWYQTKGAEVPGIAVESGIAVTPTDRDMLFCIVNVTTAGSVARYALPLVAGWEDPAASGPFEASLAMARVRRGSRVGLLTDGFASPKFARAILSALRREDNDGPGPRLIYTPAPDLIDIPADAEIVWLGADQSNSTLIVGRAVIIKLFRRLAEGIHPETEMIRVLTERGFGGIATLQGDVSYEDADGQRIAVAIVQRFAENQGDGFKWSLEKVGRLVDERAVATGDDEHVFDTYEKFMQVVGRRIGEMHAVLAEDSSNADFAPQIADGTKVASWRKEMAEQLRAAFAVIAVPPPGKTEDARGYREQFSNPDDVLNAADRALGEAEGIPLTRIHGDLHLGQILVAGSDVVIVDFEGEPLKPLGARRAKNSPLRDVAGLFRSLDYVAGTVARKEKLAFAGAGTDRASALLQKFAEKARAALLNGYGEGRGAPLTAREARLLLIFALEKAAYEIVYEASNRPDWFDIPVAGFVELADRIVRGAE